MSQLRFTRFAWGVLVYNLIVILWGAFVRATVSGDGCGSHWPDCGGQIVPRIQRTATWIEYLHRLSSGFVLVLVGVMLVWALRGFPKGHRVRIGSVAALMLTLSEALIGAALVLYRLVAHDASIYRVVAMSAHLVNTFALLAAIALTAWWSGGGKPVLLRDQGAVLYALCLGLLGTVMLAVSGAISALGDTLFPMKLLEGIRQDFSPTAHFLVRLRFLHPLIAVSVGLYLTLIAGLVSHLRPSPACRSFARSLAALFGIQLFLGMINLSLSAPIAMQLVHLLVADLVWIALVLLTATALAEGVPQIEGRPELSDAEPALTPLERATLKDYIALTKPRVISLLLFTTLAAMFIAARGWPGGLLLLAVAVGGYMAAGAANAINMVVERDLDLRMKRTAQRPTVTRKITAAQALLFAFALAVGSFALLTAAANLLTAMLALAGLFFYVIVYTLLLKRRTWHNIVIGGAAGAFPPLVGWAAVTDHLSPLAWYLFAIIFVWTPVHFWALALLIKDDYAEAGVPMLPAVLGVRVTVLQIGFYAVLTTIISLLPFARHDVGRLYLVAASVLNVALLARSLELYRHPERPQAVSLFKYSMVYLLLLFLVMAVDRAWIL